MAMHSTAMIAYIDPGTLMSQFSGIFPVIIGFATFMLAMLIWPFRFLFRIVGGKIGSVWSGYRGLGGVWQALGVAIVLGSVGLALGVWIRSDEKGTAVAGPANVILIGMDGLDPKVLESMMDADQLPHFKKLRSQGGFRTLKTSAPPESPVAWSSAATGCNPGQHGIFDFIHRNPTNYFPELSIFKPNTKNYLGLRSSKYESVRKKEGFWTFSSEAKIPTSVIRWPVTFPPEKVNGRMLTGMGTPDLRGGLGGYTFYSTRDKKDEPEPGKVEFVKWDGNRISAKLRGPQKSKKEFSEAELIVERVPDKDSVMLTVGGATVEAVLSEWTDWVRVTFKLGIGRQATGILKFHLSELSPDLRLYVLPIQLDPQDPFVPFTHPDSYAKELSNSIGLFHTMGIAEDTHSLSHERVDVDAFLEDVEEIHADRSAMFDYELERYEGGLLAFVFDASDRVQHIFWSTRDPEHPAHDPKFAEDYGHVIPDIYKKMDAELGKAMDNDGLDATIMVMSDHGFNSFRRGVHVNTWLVENGYMTLKAGVEEGRELFQDVDWSKTKAYCLGFTSIYINLKGRERDGIVEQGEEHRKLCVELSKKLTDLQDPKTGDRPIYRVHNGREVYAGQEINHGPDLVLGFAEGYRISWQTPLGGAPNGEIIVDNTKRWTGDHLIDPSFVPGIFLSNRPIRKDLNPRLIDIAPTVCQCLGIEKPGHMDGVELLTGS